MNAFEMKCSCKFLIAAFVAVFGFTAAGAQNSDDVDFGLWASAEVSYAVHPKFEISLSEEIRTNNNVRNINQLKTTLGFGSKINKHLKVGFGYIMKNYRNTTLSSGWEFRHRYFVYVTGSYKVARVKFSLREYLQGTHRIGVDAKVNPEFYSKTRLKIEYDIRKSMFTPYVTAEVYAALNDSDLTGWDAFDRIRYSAGTEIKLDKHNRLDVFARFTTKRDWKPKRKVFKVENSAIVSVGYSYSF